MSRKKFNYETHNVAFWDVKSERVVFQRLVRKVGDRRFVLQNRQKLQFLLGFAQIAIKEVSKSGFNQQWGRNEP